MVQLDQTNDRIGSGHRNSLRMLLRFSECRKRFGSPYQIEKAVREGRLFKMAPGVYSESGEESEIEVLQAQYPKSVLSLDSAYYYYDMTDEVPELYVLATADNSPRIKNTLVRQLYVPAGALMLGATEYDYEGERLRIYDLERLLVETARMKNLMPADLYKEIVLWYRANLERLDPSKIGEYAVAFPHKDRIMSVIDSEVY